MSKSSTAPTVTQPRASRALLIGGALIATLVLLVVLPPAWRAAVILGIVEGVTEFLPISSTGHLLITSRLLGFESPLGSTFEIFIQLGAVLAVVGYYMRDLLQQARDVTRDASVRRFWIGVVVAFLPAALLGLLFKDFIKAVLLDSPTIIAWALIIGGIVFIAIERLPRRPATTDDIKQMSLRQALSVGLMQVLAFVPGASR